MRGVRLVLAGGRRGRTLAAALALALAALLACSCAPPPEPAPTGARSLPAISSQPTWAGRMAPSLPHVDQSGLWADWDLDRDDDLVLAEDGRVHLVQNVAGVLTRVHTTEVFEDGVVTGMDWTPFAPDPWGRLAIAGAGSGPSRLRVYSVHDGRLEEEWDDGGSVGALLDGVAWGDCDGDGDPDLAGATAYQPPFVLQDGGDGYELAWTGSVPSPEGRVAWADLDGDGRASLVQLAADSTAVLHSPGGGCPGLGDLPIGDAPAIDLALGDLDGDGAPDLVTSSSDGVDVRMTSDGLPLDPIRVSGHAFQRDDRLHLVDLLDSGWRDIVAGSRAIPALGSGEFGPDEELPCDFEPCGEPLDWGGLDGDGRADLLEKTSDAIPGRQVLRVRQRRSGQAGYSVRSEFSWLALQDVLLLDWDRDGRLDVAVTGWGWSGLYLAIPDTNGTENDDPAATFGSGLSGQALAACDLDGDGADELAAAFSDAGVVVYRDEGGSPQPWRQLPARSGWAGRPLPATALLCADWDGDGAQELALGYGGEAPAVFGLQGDEFVESWVDEGGPMWTRSLAWANRRSPAAGRALVAADLLGPDRLYVPGEGGQVEVRAFRPDVATTALAWIGGLPAPGVGHLSETPLLVAGDVDGRVDVLRLDDWPPQVLASRPLAGAVVDLAAGDLDGDLLPDIAAGALQVSWALSGPDLLPLPIAAVPQLRPLGGLALGDVNNDGALDLVRAPGVEGAGSGLPAATLQRGSLQIASRAIPEQDGAALLSPEEVDLADLDGDGLADLVVSGLWGTTAGLATGLAGSPFDFIGAPGEPGGPVALGRSPDGALLALQDGQEPVLRLYRVEPVDGPGELRFDETQEIDLAGPAADLAWADADRDGDLDLAVAADVLFADEIHRGTTLLESRGGQLVPSWSSGSTEVSCLSWGDVDADGWPDLAEGSSSGYDVVFQNVRAWSEDWLRPVQLFDGMETRRVQLGDWNGDGLADLLRAGQGASGIELHRNVHGIGEGWLALAWSTSLEQDVDDASWVDLDGDGDLDVLALASDGATTRLLVAGNPAWGPALSEAAVLGAGDGAPFRRLAATDMDADGDVDVVLAGEGLIYLSSPVHPRPALPGTPTFPWIGAPAGSPPAGDWASVEAVTEGEIELPCRIFDGEGDLPRPGAVRIEYALGGSTAWRLGDFELRMEPPAGGLADCRVTWRIPDEGLGDPSVRVRMTLLWQGPSAVPQPVEYGRTGATSPPFPVDVPADSDGDGFRAGADCDDGESGVRPGAVEVCDDGIDQDCDGADSGPLDPHCWPEAAGCACGAARGRYPPPLPVCSLVLLFLLGRRNGYRRPRRAAAVPADSARSVARARPRRGRRAAPMLLVAVVAASTSGPATASDPAGSVDPASVPGDDADPAAIRADLAAGRCDAALQRAQALAGSRPAPDVLVLLGDAAACLGRDREAAIAFRQAEAASRADPLLALKLERVEARLASLVVEIDVPEAAPPPEIALRLGDDPIPGGTPDAPGFTFVDLSAGVPLSIRIGGDGWAQDTIRVPALLEGERRVLAVDAHFLGFGRVVVGGAPPEGCSIEIVSAAGPVPFQPGEALLLSAGPLGVRAAGGLGRRDFTVDVPRDATIYLEPEEACPAALLLRRMPAPSVVRLSQPGDEAGPQVVVVSGEGRLLDPTSGAWQAPPQSITSLRPGRTGLSIESEVLGSWAGEVDLVPGRESVLDLEPALMPRAAIVRDAFVRHRRGLDGRFAAGFGASLAAAHVLAILSAVLEVQAEDLGTEADSVRDLAIAADASGNDVATLAFHARWEPLWSARRELRSGAVAAGAGAVIASGVAITFTVHYGRRRITWSGWEPPGPATIRGSGGIGER